MSLQTRLTALAQAIGADVKSLVNRVSTVESTLVTQTASVPPTTAMGYRNAALSLATGAGVPMDTEGFSDDPKAFHDTAINPTRFTVPSGMDGTYLVIGKITYATNTGTAFRGAEIWKNGVLADSARAAAAPATNTTAVKISSMVKLISGEYIELVAAHGEAGAIALATGLQNVFLQLIRLDSPTQVASTMAGAPFEAWRVVGAAGQPAFQNNWVQAAGVSPVTAFCKNALGLVVVKGVITAGTVDATAFTLPDGYRPSELTYWQDLAPGAVAGNYIGVYPDGRVVLHPGGAGSTHYVYLVFLADGPNGRSGGSGIPVLTALPNTAVDGQEIYLTVDQAGAYGGPYRWHCQYDASITKWHVLAGGPLVGQTPDSWTVTSSTGVIGGYVDSGQVAITMPFNMDADTVTWMRSDMGANTTNDQTWVTLADTVANAADANAVTNRNLQFVNASRERRRNGLVKGTTYRLFRKSSGTNAGRLFDHGVVIRPVRIW